MKMMSANMARNIVGIIGNVISLWRFLSPVPTFVRIWKNKAVEEFSPIPYLATLINCMMWVFYAVPVIHPHSTLVITINCAGIIIEFIYLAIFVRYATPTGRSKVLKWLAAEIVFTPAVVMVVLMGVHTHEERTLIVGVMCIVFGTCTYASPLAAMRNVIQTRSVRYMPFTLSLASFLSGVCWTLYALIRSDIFITIPNGLGTLLGFAQLVLYGFYYSSTPREEPNSGGPAAVGDVRFPRPDGGGCRLGIPFLSPPMVS